MKPKKSFFDQMESLISDWGPGSENASMEIDEYVYGKKSELWKEK